MSCEITALDNLRVNESGQIMSLLSSGPERRRFLDLGLVTDTSIEVVQKSPSGDPVAYLVRGTVLALRNNDANKILVKVKW